jgi:catalase
MRALYRHPRVLATLQSLAAVVIAGGVAYGAWAWFDGWKRNVIVALAAGWVGARLVYPATNRLFGRLVGLCLAVGAFCFLTFELLRDGWWWAFGAFVLAGPALIAIAFRVSQGRHLDSVPRDDVLVPLMSDGGEQLVDALDSIWGSTRRGGGRHGLRAAHTHGSLALGGFELARTLDDRLSIPLLTDSPIRAVARFSNFSGDVERDDRHRQVHGLALKLESQTQAPLDMVLIDVKRFVAANPDDFEAVVRHYRRPGLRRYVGLFALAVLGRTRLIALVRIRPKRPPSYLTRTYHGVNTFYWGRDRDRAIPVRYRVVPHHTRRAILPRRLDRYMLDAELQERLRDGVELRLELVDGSDLSHDRLVDPMRAWPRCMPVFHLGHVTLTGYDGSDERDPSLFQPLRLPEGVNPSDDEILLARRGAYSSSYLRRRPVDLVVR